MRARDPERRRHRRVAIVVSALAVVLAGCGTGSDLPSNAGTAARQADNGSSGDPTISVVMQSLDFSPIAVKGRVGQRVTWLNEDQARHNVTYISGPHFRSSGRRMRIGDRFTITLTAPGTIHYVCTLHPWMHATITVSR